MSCDGRRVVDRLSADADIFDEGSFTPGGRGWTAWDGMAVTVEDAWFLYGLVRLLRPRVVVSGSGGRSAVVLAGALADCDPLASQEEEPRRLYVYEAEPSWLETTEEWVARYVCDTGRLEVVYAVGDASEHGESTADLVFLDSAAGLREGEIEHWFSDAAPLAVEGVVVVHDAGLGGRGTESVDWRESPLRRYVYLPSARGLGVWARGAAKERR